MLLFAEHFDNYIDTVNFNLRRKASAATAGLTTYDATGGRWGGGALKPNSLQSGTRYPIITPAGNLVRVAFWFKSNQAGSATGSRPIIALRGTDSGVTPVAWMFFNSGTAGATTLGCCRYDDDLSPSIAANTTTVIGDGTWHHIELKLIAANSLTGEIEIHIDGVLDASVNVFLAGDSSGFAGVNVPVFTEIQIAGCSTNTGSATDIFIDDVIVWDDSGTGFTGALTDMHRLRVVPAKADGTLTDFTPSTGSNYENVDDTTTDDDTTYNETSTVGDEDRYTLSNTLGFIPGTVMAAIVETHVKRTDIKAMNMRNLIDDGSTQVNGDTEVVYPTYRCHQSFFDLAPDAAAWTKTKLETVDFGLEYVS